MLVGNPAQPALQTRGVCQTTPTWWDFRIAYFGDYVYNQPSQDAFPQLGKEAESYDMQLWTQAGMFIFNLCNRIDLYGIIGGLRIQNSDELSTSQQFAWGVGGKIIFLHEGPFRMGCDIKYFASNQSPQFFRSGHLAYNVTTDNFSMNYSEFQAAVGLSYKTKYVSPYISGSYILSELTPNPATVFLRIPIPSRRREVRLTVKSITATTRFGLVIGTTLIDHQKATITAEWRTFNQNSINVSGELRF